MISSNKIVESLISDHAIITPDKTAIIDEKGNRITYAELWKNILQANDSLRHHAD